MLKFNYTLQGGLSPIPIASLYLNNLNNTNFVLANNAILDTGSDCTLFPYSMISKIQSKPLGENAKQLFRGLGTEVIGIPYRIGIGFEENINTIIRTKIFACPDDILNYEIIIGRNFLNRYQIEFNGPARTFLIY